MVLDEKPVARDLGYPSTVELADGSLVSVWHEQLPGETLASVQAAHWALGVKRSALSVIPSSCSSCSSW